MLLFRYFFHPFRLITKSILTYCAASGICVVVVDEPWKWRTRKVNVVALRKNLNKWWKVVDGEILSSLSRLLMRTMHLHMFTSLGFTYNRWYEIRHSSQPSRGIWIQFLHLPATLLPKRRWRQFMNCTNDKAMSKLIAEDSLGRRTMERGRRTSAVAFLPARNIMSQRVRSI